MYMIDAVTCSSPFHAVLFCLLVEGISPMIDSKSMVKNTSVLPRQLAELAANQRSLSVFLFY